MTTSPTATAPTTRTVPLAIWLPTQDSSATRPAGNQTATLARAVAAYQQPGDGITVTLTRNPSTLHSSPDPTVTVLPYGAPGRFTDRCALVVLDQPSPTDLTRARQLLHPGGRLVTVTHPPAHRPGRVFRDLLPALIEAARRSGLRYQQHVLALHDVDPQPMAGAATTHPVTSDDRPPPVAARAHSDVLVFTDTRERP